MAKWGTSNLSDLAALQSASSKDANSLSVYHHFLSSTDLHTTAPWLDGKGTSLSEVTDDIDGDSRGGSVDIGADQFVPVAGTTTPLSGTFTIGSGGDYNTFKDASDDLLLKGISAAVTFNVLNGSYNEQVVIHETPGASATNTITIQSQSGNAADVTLWYFAAGAGDNYIVLVRGADFMRFRNMTFWSNNVAPVSYGKILYLWGGVEDLNIEDNILKGSPTNSGSQNLALIYGINMLSSPRIIRNNTFNDGGYSIWLQGVNTTTLASGTEVSGNTLTHVAYGMYFYYQKDLIVTGNSIDATQGQGINVTYGDGAMKITKNKISTGNTNGIYLNACDGGVAPTGTPGLIANNFVTSNANSARGIYLTSSTYQNIYSNSVNSRTGTDSRSFETSQGSNIKVVNNIFANHGGGYAYVINQTGAIVTSDYNDLYTNGTKLAYWNGDILDLAALQTANSMDASSVSATPQYASSFNLHASAGEIHNAGTPLSEVIDDIDGELRDGSTPDIGADEFIFGFNYSPVITTLPDTVAYTDSLYKYQVSASDNNGDTLTFKLSTAPFFLGIDSTTGLVQGTPASGDEGEHTVVVLVEDGNGGTDTQIFTLTVQFPVGIDQLANQFPNNFIVFQNYPNPFNPSTNIKFGLPNSAIVRIDVFNILGQRVRTLVNKKMSAGYHIINFQAQGLASGAYIYNIHAGKFVESKKMFIIK